jgi:hypothetical protein
MSTIYQPPPLSPDSKVDTLLEMDRQTEKFMPWESLVVPPDSFIAESEKIVKHMAMIF